MRLHSHAPRTAQLALSAALGLALVGCTDDSRTGAGASPTPALGDVPSPVATVPAYARNLSQTVGEYVVAPGEGHDEADARAVAQALSGTPGVQSAEVQDGLLRVELTPTCTAADRARVLRQMAALGEVDEGI